jgi:hypothetical protein
MAYDADCIIESVGETGNNDQWVIYPNPASDEVFIAINSNQNWQTITLLSMDGRIIEQSAINGQNLMSLQTAELASGIYMIQLNSLTGTSTKKLMIK